MARGARAAAPRGAAAHQSDHLRRPKGGGGFLQTPGGTAPYSQAGSEPGPSVFPIARCLIAGELANAERLLQASRKKGNGSSNRILHHSLITECAKAGNLHAAEWCIKHMTSTGLEPNTVTFNCMLNACAKAGNVELATVWWRRMVEYGLKPNGITYNTMILAGARAGDAWQAEHWIQKMIKEGVLPCVVSFGTVIEAFAKIGNLSKAEWWFSRMQEAGVTPDAVIYRSLIKACAKADQLPSARRRLREKKQDRSEALPQGTRQESRAASRAAPADSPQHSGAATPGPVRGSDLGAASPEGCEAARRQQQQLDIQRRSERLEAIRRRRDEARGARQGPQVPQRKGPPAGPQSQALRPAEAGARIMRTPKPAEVPATALAVTKQVAEQADARDESGQRNSCPSLRQAHGHPGVLSASTSSSFAYDFIQLLEF